MKFVIALLAITVIACFLLLNMGRQAQLRLFRELQVGTLTLVGVSFFAGAAFMFLIDLWRHWKKDRAGVAAKRTGRYELDGEL
ncbi:hypothetical protein ACFL1X_02305 [Candidatus Hydrogenedentota bacterium]